MEHVTITLHAHSQYCSRVELIDYAELNRRINERYKSRQWTYNKEQFVQIDGVWWIKQQDGNNIIFVTCYGSIHIDVPAALRWARRQNDRLAFDFW